MGTQSKKIRKDWRYNSIWRCVLELMTLKIDEIVLDLSNPRIAKYLEMYGGSLNAEQIALALGAGDSTIDDSSTTFGSLKASIKTNGGVIHPIIVNKQQDGKFVVIEGNTRVAIYNEFNQDKKMKGNWDTIPAIVYKSLTQAQIDAIRLQAHLVGTREWDPYSKAKYLDFLYNAENLSMNQVIDFCGGNRTQVLRYIDAYKLMESHYRQQLDSDDQFDHTRFSAFVEFQNKRIKDAVYAAGFSDKDFAKWVIEQKFEPLRTIRGLPRILENEKSKGIFFKKKHRGAEEALKLLEAQSADVALKEADVFQLAQELKRKILVMKYEVFQELQKNPEGDTVMTLMDLMEQLKDFCDNITAE